jgi:phage nucleotide-binding protein
MAPPVVRRKAPAAPVTGPAVIRRPAAIAAPVTAAGVPPRRKAPPVTEEAAPVRRSRRDDVITEGLLLSTELSEPVKSLEEVNWLIYGDAGIGKSSLASMFKGAYFLFFEPGGKGMSLHKSECHNWAKFKHFAGLLAKQTQFKTIVFDVVDSMYDRCFEYVCRREGMEHPNEKKWGEGWKAIRAEFEGEVLKLWEADKSLIFISHAKDKAFQTRSGKEYNKIVPSMGAQAFEFVSGFVDVMGFYGYNGDERYLTIRGSDEVEAKNRLKYRFRTADGKRKVHSIPLFDERNEDYDEEDAFKAIVSAFNNQQKTTGEPELPVTLANIALKPKKRQ